ncbi:MAG: DUF1080 domain-containing protein [Verrucomicrobiales bacterium]|nr:DUF1080 domain-containing protein [Verrucomicrobiales bacterium]
MKFIPAVTALFCIATSSLQAAEPTTLSLSDFTTTAGAAPGDMWKAEDGNVIHLAGKGGGSLISKAEYTNFELEWDWKLDVGGNNGIKYWVTQIGGKEWLGIEYQMIDDNEHPDAKRGDSHSTACIYDIKAAAKDKPLKGIGEWNTSKIVVQDGKIQHWLNGALVSEADTTTDDWKQRIAASKFKSKVNFAPGHGKIMLTEHGDETWFRNIRIKAL